MRNHSSISVAAILAVAALSPRAEAYVDLAPTLGKIVGDAKSIALVAVVGFDPATQTVTFKPVRTLKGDALTAAISNRVAPPGGVAAPAVRRWAAAGSNAVWFSTKSTALVCIGTSWYQAKKSGDEWKLGVDRPDLALAYCGSPRKLSAALEQMLAGRTAVLTTVVYGATDVDTSFDLALGRTNLPGLVKVQRVRGSLDMAGAVMAASASGNYVVGPGPIDPADLPALRKLLTSGSSEQQADAAEAIGHLGRAGAEATADLRTLLSSTASHVRTAAAGAMLRVASGAETAEALVELSGDMGRPIPQERRDALNAAALAGLSAAVLASSVIARCGDPDEAVKASALATLATLGPLMSAKESRSAVAMLGPMLADERWRIEAADALGRLGEAARPLPAGLITMLQDPQPPVQWAAVRAMAQIGGPEAKPAVDFIKAKLPNAPEVEQYNMMIYLALLGPQAGDAAAVIRSTRMKNPVLPGATLWAIGDTTVMPWQQEYGHGGPAAFGGPDGEGPGSDGAPAGLGAYMYAAYFRELGDRLRPASTALAKKLLDGTAGNVPDWGYALLTADTAASLAILTPKLADPDRTIRQRAAITLGYMDEAAIPAIPQLRIAAENAHDDRERRLLQWALRKIEKPQK